MPTLKPMLVTLLQRLDDVSSHLGQLDQEHAHQVSTRLQSSVIRPLHDLTQLPEEAQGNADPHVTENHTVDLPTPATVDDHLWQVAHLATTIMVQFPHFPALIEAIAALQDLALTGTDASTRAQRRAELSALQATLPAHIQVAKNGPYLVTNAQALVDGLGQAMAIRPIMALCRCGASTLKPFCDGAHAAIHFDDAKDPQRVPDQRETYVGQQVTILDNRGTCQHSGLCTSRLATVFRVDQEPFVAPSGGRMDEIIRAVRDCPSGALSYAIDGVEARADMEYHGTRLPSIMVTTDGPYRMTGNIPLVDSIEKDVVRNAGASHEHYALCRCGHSQNKPFCSGMHWYIQFHDPIPHVEATPTIFAWAGGLPALTRMTRLFYEKFVPQDPLLAPLFAKMSVDHPERVAKWLGEVFCGPQTYSTEYGGYVRMISQHLGKGLTEEQRVRWVSLLLQSAHEAGLPNDPEFRSAFSAYIEWGSRLAVENSQTGARPPSNMPMPHWDWTTAAGPPGSRISALVDEEAPEPALPAADVPLHFDQHIKPLFRQRDRQSMRFAFDLWSTADVRQHAPAILQRLLAGTMPCDGAWPPPKIAVFQRWIDSGMPE